MYNANDNSSFVLALINAFWRIDFKVDTHVYINDNIFS